jgi:DNA-binding NarL/FixJ family response regulator
MSEPARSCVLLADRHHRLLEGIRGLLETAFSNVFMVADESSLIEGTVRLQPGLVVADLSLAAGDAAGLMRQLHAAAPGAKVLLLTVHDAPNVAQSAIALGADGLVLKRAIATDLLPAIEAVLAGMQYVSPAIAGRTSREPADR